MSCQWKLHFQSFCSSSPWASKKNQNTTTKNPSEGVQPIAHFLCECPKRKNCKGTFVFIHQCQLIHQKHTRNALGSDHCSCLVPHFLKAFQSDTCSHPSPCPSCCSLDCRTSLSHAQFHCCSFCDSSSFSFIRWLLTLVMGQPTLQKCFHVSNQRASLQFHNTSLPQTQIICSFCVPNVQTVLCC